MMPNQPTAEPTSFKLDSLEELFTSKEFSWNSQSPFRASVIEETLKSLKAKKPIVRLSIELPSLPSLEDQLRARTLWTAFCENKIQDAREDLKISRRRGRTALYISLLILAVCLGTSTLASTTQALPEFLRSLLSEGLVIVGWVAMWRPAEILLLDWWDPVQTIRLHQHLKSLPLEFTSRSQ